MAVVAATLPIVSVNNVPLGAGLITETEIDDEVAKQPLTEVIVTE